MPRIHDHENEITYFGTTNFRQGGVKFGIKTDDRRRHMYIVGKTGMGKTTLLENMVLQDIYNGHGLCYMDPHGDTVEGILDYIPSWRINDVVYFNPADLDNPIGFNVLDAVSLKHKHLVAAGLMGVFKKIWENMWSARMEYILGNTILALLDTPGSTLLGINRMYSDEAYRLEIVKNIKDPVVKQFWVMEYAGYSEKYATEAVAAVQNKIGQFLSSDVIRNIVAQVKSTIDIRHIMDDQKIFLVNLSKGRIGEDNSRLLGGMLITKIQLSAMERVDIPDQNMRKDFYLYVDEFQNFATESFANILSEARKYRLNLIVAHQYTAQLAEEVKDAVFGNVGTMVIFRVGAPDAQDLETEMMPRFTPEDLINLPKYAIYLKLMIDGVSSAPFSAGTLPPIAKRTGSADKVVRVSRERYASQRDVVEQKVLKWTGLDESVDVEEVIEAQKAKASGQQPKKKHKYKCSHCAKDMSIPVKLDRSRPVYCEDCRQEVAALKKEGKYDPRKDLIYDEDLNVVGSVAELGTDGSWALRDKDGNIIGRKDPEMLKKEKKERSHEKGSKSRDRGRDGKGRGTRNDRPSAKSEPPPKPKDTQPVIKEVKEEASLDALKPKPREQKAKSKEQGGSKDSDTDRSERVKEKSEERSSESAKSGGESSKDAQGTKSDDAKKRADESDKKSERERGDRRNDSGGGRADREDGQQKKRRRKRKRNRGGRKEKESQGGQRKEQRESGGNGSGSKRASDTSPRPEQGRAQADRGRSDQKSQPLQEPSGQPLKPGKTITFDE